MTEEGAQGRPPAGCAWCGAELGPSSARSGGRSWCASCGAATTDPWPSAEELERAYARYRPASGRFAGIGRRGAAPHPRSSRRSHRPRGAARPGARRGRRRRHPARRAPRARPGSARPGAGLAACGRARGGHHRARRSSGRQSSSGTRWSTCPAPAPAIDHAARHLRPGGLLLVAVPNTAEPAGAGVRRPLVSPRPAAASGPPAGRGARRRRLRALGLSVTRVSHWRGGQALFGWLHGLVGACRADRTSTTRSGAPRRAAARCRGARRGCSPSARPPLLFPVAALATAVEVATAAAARSTWRRGVPERPAGKVIVVMPAMNAARTLERTVEAIPRDWVDEVVLVDDASSDDTVELARRLPLHVVWHPHNAGYGANQKTCYLEALQRDADVVVMLHPDGQYEPELIGSMVEPILAGRRRPGAGLAAGLPGMALANGMPRWKYVVNRALTTVENRIMGTEPVRGAHGLPRLLAPAASDRARSCATPPTSASTRSCSCRRRTSACGSRRCRLAGATSRRPPRSACAAASCTG